MKKTVLVLIMSVLCMGTLQADDYSSLETVHFVLQCMSDLGGETDENLYTCVCRYDTIRHSMTFSSYEEGRTYERNRAMPGEKGAFFRDNERGKGFYEELVKIREQANNNCPVVKKVELKKSKN